MKRAPTPTTILHNAHIITMDTEFSTAEAVLIRSGRFAAVGSNEMVLALADDSTEIIDLGGKPVVPGLIDSHLHLHWAAMNAPKVQLLDCRSIASIQSAVEERAATSTEGEWIIGSSGWHESLLAENRLPTRDELDAVAPNNPVFLPRGGHVGTANSRALALAGITEHSDDPPGGLIVRELSSRRPTGVLLEAAAALVRDILPVISSMSEQKSLLRDAMGVLNSYGIVSTLEPGLNGSQIAVYDSLRNAGEMTVRLDLMYRANNLNDTKAGLKFADFEGDDLLRFVGIKFMLDGGVEGGRFSKPYRLVPGEQNDPEYYGLSLLPAGGEEEFIKSLELVAQAGLQVQCHGVGDVTIDLIVRAYQTVDRQTPIRNLRWVVMHMHVPTADAIKKMIDTGILVTVQDQNVLLGANMVKWWGRERASFSTPTRLLIDSGLLVGGGTDAPILPIDPFICMWWMVTRKTLQGEQLGPEHSISAQEALALYTINNARIMGVDSERGSIEVGKMADLAVLSQNLLAVPDDDIRQTKAVMTMLGGKIVYRRS